MKKITCLMLLMCLCAVGALAEDAGIGLCFDEGFALTLPSGWVRYQVSEPGVRYALGDGSGERFLYILAEPSTYANFEALSAELEAREDCGKISALDLGGQPFAAFIVPGQNASGCATIWNHEVLTFMFTPQSDSDYMLTVAQIMASFRSADG